MNEEIEAIEKNSTWELVKLPESENQLDLSGYTRLKEIIIEKSQGIKLGWWLKESVR